VQGAKKLDSAAKGRLKALYDARERIAERLDRPAFKVFGEEVLLDMVHTPPTSLDDFRTPKGGRRHGAGRFAQEVLAALAQAQPIEGEPPKNSGRRRRNGRMLDPDARQRYEALRVQRRLSADALGLEPEVVLSNAIIEELARTPPGSAEDFLRHAEFCGWRKTPLLAPMQAVLEGLAVAAAEQAASLGQLAQAES
jgi:ribonuclease D